MTGKVEWFRRTTWTDTDAADFEARLKRSRGVDRKAQYLRIQAGHLLAVGDPKLTSVALSLLDRQTAQFPDPLFLSVAHSMRAEALLELGRSEEAVEAYQLALLAREAFPQVRTDAHLGFAELVI